VQIAEAKSSGVLLSLHLKATMMKVSDDGFTRKSVHIHILYYTYIYNV
jgi:monomeric isocitrate dehydrogenase